MHTIRLLHTLFARRLRLGNPWNYKAPVLIAVTYCMMLWLEFSLKDALLGFLWSLCTILGIAGFGYLSNDLGDRKADQKAGKSNLLAQIPMVQIIALLLGFVVLALVPWVVFFPLDLLAACLLAAEFLLFILYVLPPFRLKERGLLGVVADALYAHAIPAILAAITFGALAGREPAALFLFLLGLGLWQFCLGMRNILLHQLKDVGNDRISGIRTFVTVVGEERVHHLLLRVFVPMELLCWLLFLGILAPVTWLPLVGWPVYLAWQLPRQTKKRDLRGWLYSYLDDFYIPWFPILVLAALTIQDWQMVILLALHVLLFKTSLSPVRDRLFRLIFKPA
jgi:4-hydroxybenzoate polyprenyltransferase